MLWGDYYLLNIVKNVIMNYMSIEKFPHIPNVPTTPERIIQKRGKMETVEGARLSPEEIEKSVDELMELSSARKEASAHSRERWGLTKKEQEELEQEEQGAVLVHLESLSGDPELVEMQKEAIREYDDRIRELASNSQVMEEYKKRFKELKGVLASVVHYEHISKESEAVDHTLQKIRQLFERVGRSPGPIERKKLSDLEERKRKIEGQLEAFEFTDQMAEMLHRREIRRIQRNLQRYNFAETESHTALIREVLPDLIQGAPVLFQGETGSGKTQLARYISERYIGKKPVVISINEQIKESQIMGSRGLEAGQTVFQYSEFVKALRDGTPVILDEVNLMPHEFAGILHELLQKRMGDVWVHPTTGEKILIQAPIFATANLKSERYRQRYELDPATIRRFIGGAGAREVHYLDFGKKDSDGRLIAPETLKILATVLADRNGDIQWSESEAPLKLDEMKRFVGACRKIQEDFTLGIREGGQEESFARTDRLAFREMVITLKDQIEIMKAWKASGFRESLEDVLLREFFHKAEVSGRAEKDRANMLRVFIANKFFQAIDPARFKIHSLDASQIRRWQGRE